MFRATVYFILAQSAFASTTLDVLVSAAAGLLARIQQRLGMHQNGPSPTETAERTMDYAEAKAVYFKALPMDLMNVVRGRRAGAAVW